MFWTGSLPRKWSILKIAGFGKELMKNLVQFPRRSEIAPERLFHHDARIFRGARMRQSFRYRGEHAGRDREIVQRPLRISQKLAQLGEGLRLRDNRRPRTGAGRTTLRTQPRPGRRAR